METIITRINRFFAEVITAEKLFSFFWFFIVIGIILIAFRLLRKIVMQVAEQKCNVQVQHVISKGINYTGIAIVIMTVFNRLGINFSALLGAAGIAGIAVGFAAQTSVSNVISGVFVMTERAFKIGDLLQVDSIIGTVESIDLLSIRLKTPENQLVRIPNETPGTYALAVIHDENMNGKLDTNWLGIPIEGYGFSNGAKGLFGAPSFSAARFPYDGRILDLTISLHY
jgi:small-conductance mechanosensitive channel